MAWVGLMDCNNFFVSCERLFRPDLIGRPVAVLSSNDGCIVARSEEVKALGVPMGIPLFQAKQLVDMGQVTLFSSNFALYRDLSARVMTALAAEVGACEVYSIDEAFFTLTEQVSEAELQLIRAAIIARTGIPVSIGAARTKTLAKIASKQAKQQGGVRLLTLARWQDEAAVTPLGAVWNLGSSTEKTLRQHQCETPAAFMAAPRSWVKPTLGISGCRLQDELNGISVYPVHANSTTLRQSVTSTRSFPAVTGDRPALEAAVTYHLTEVAEKLRQLGLAPQWLTVELRAGRHSDFAWQRGTVTLPLATATNRTADLLKLALRGVGELYQSAIPYKKAGVIAGGLLPLSAIQPALFATGDAVPDTALDELTDQLNARFGAHTIHPATLIDRRPKTNANAQSPHYTTQWKDIPTVSTG